MRPPTSAIRPRPWREHGKPRVNDDATTDSPVLLRVHVLGGFRVWVRDQAVPASAWRPKAAALVKLLALSPQQRLHREELLEQLWPALPEQAAMNNLHRTLHAARRSLAPFASWPFLRFEAQRLVLCAGVRAQVDSLLFAQRAASARASRQLEHYQAALELYRGELLPEDRYEDWAARPREEALELYLDLASDLAELYLQRKHYRPACELLRAVVRQELALEAAQLSLMRLYLLLGQPQSAMTQYERLRRALKREYGFAPCQAATQLYERLLEESEHGDE